MTSTDCNLTCTVFGRWILTHPHTHALGWSGSSWVEIDENGIALGLVKVSSFDTSTAAIDYARRMGLTVLKRGARVGW